MEGGSNAFRPDRSIFYCITLVIIYTYRTGDIHIYRTSNIHTVWHGIMPRW
jgi:hypothetical protein